MPPPDDRLHFDSQAALAQSLAAHHATSNGVWLRHAKKGAPNPSVTYQQALEVALCFGWIDGQRQGLGDSGYLQRWTPRRARSIWSKVNRKKALRYIEEGACSRAAWPKWSGRARMGAGRRPTIQ